MGYNLCCRWVAIDKVLEEVFHFFFVLLEDDETPSSTPTSSRTSTQKKRKKISSNRGRGKNSSIEKPTFVKTPKSFKRTKKKTIMVSFFVIFFIIFLMRVFQITVAFRVWEPSPLLTVRKPASSPFALELRNITPKVGEGRREKKKKIVEEGIQKSRRSDKRKFTMMAALEKRIFKPFAVHFTKIHFKTLLNTKQLNKHCLVLGCDICLIPLLPYHPIALLLQLFLDLFALSFRPSLITSIFFSSFRLDFSWALRPILRPSPSTLQLCYRTGVLSYPGRIVRSWTKKKDWWS